MQLLLGSLGSNRCIAGPTPHSSFPPVQTPPPHPVRLSRRTAWCRDRKSTRLNSSHPSTYPLSLHDALPISCPQAIGRRQRIVSWLHERHPIVRSQCSFYWGHLAPTAASPDQLLIAASRRFKRHHRTLSDFLGEPHGVEIGRAHV